MRLGSILDHSHSRIIHIVRLFDGGGASLQIGRSVEKMQNILDVELLRLRQISL